ncbi:Glutamate-1-semialdehyde 2,1-aminomutase 2 [Achromobacter spanius]|nr:Glutamate-1-semialdehyde 2,1-aminomutase [Achromobacter spanius]VEE56675.1 Glutamate-1-semialdehyde 2,1-aminomutase 2 [Achromobacter spanius]
MQFEKSKAYGKIANQLIPGGGHTYSKGDDQFPELSPGFITRGKGSQAWDLDGNQFLDWGMGLRSVCLGHAYEPVLDSVRKQLENGVNFTRPAPLEAELAQLLVDLVPCAEMVKFAKNGSDVTTAAVRLARAFTGRDMIIRCLDHPFFSVDDWFIGDTAMDAGIPQSSKDLTRHFPFNDAKALERLLEENNGKVACIILEAAATSAPVPGFLERVRELATQHGAVLVFDEIISGFRWNVRDARPCHLRQGHGQRLLAVGLGGTARHHGTRRPGSPTSPRIPVVDHQRCGNAFAGRIIDHHQAAA